LANVAAQPAEFAAHSTEADDKPHYKLYLMCDHLNAIMKDLKRKGCEMRRRHRSPLRFDYLNSSAWRWTMGL